MLYVYDDLGDPLTTTGDDDYVTSSDYSPYGEVQRLQLGEEGHRAWLTYLYDDHTRRLDRSVVDAEVPHAMQSDAHYAYNPAGNITSISNIPLDQPADNQCFRYDYLQRLTDAWTPSAGACDNDPNVASLSGPAPYWQSFTYDKSGNRLTDTEHTGAGDVTRKYNYADPGAAKPHLLNSMSTPGKPDASYTYDQVGNTKTRPGTSTTQNLDWTVEGQLDSVTEGTTKTSYTYDADGSRLLRHDPTGTTLYLGGQEVHVDNAGQAATTRYYSHGGATVAVRTGGMLTWLAGDHQGTSQVAINSNDLSVTQRRQTPFGAPRGAATDLPGDRSFVGGTEDTSTGLTQLGARAYDASAGRFVSLDPMFDAANPQQINGYSYANNSPVASSDPSGLEPLWNPDCPDVACRNKGYGMEPGDFKRYLDAENRRADARAQNTARATWKKIYSPKTSDPVDLDSWLTSVLHNSGADWRDNQISDNERICFGQTGCERAHAYLATHKNDVEGAKVIAATYCLDHYEECKRNAHISGGVDFALSIAFGSAEGVLVAVSGSGAGRNVAKEAADALRLFGVANGAIRSTANVAGAEVLIEGRPGQILQAVSGKTFREGTVPRVGAPGNPQRYITIPTKNNDRTTDTELKILNYVANQLGEPSPSVRGTINLHSEFPVCESCAGVIDQFRSEFPGIRLNVTSGG